MKNYSEKIPENNQIECVSTFYDLMDFKFSGEKNAVCWKRALKGDFQEIVSKFQSEENILEISTAMLLDLKLSESGNIAREILINDLQLLTDSGAQPSLNIIRSYDRDQEFDFISTDVYSYHVDRSPVPTSTFLCTYFGASSDILPNHQATQKILIPEIRAKLYHLYQGPEEDFDRFLEDNYFDLHYQPAADANSVNLGIGNLWRLAVDGPEKDVLPCIHRAPKENEGECRLLLIC